MTFHPHDLIERWSEGLETGRKSHRLLHLSQTLHRRLYLRLRRCLIRCWKLHPKRNAPRLHRHRRNHPHRLPRHRTMRCHRHQNGHHRYSLLFLRSNHHPNHPLRFKWHRNRMLSRQSKVIRIVYRHRRSLHWKARTIYHRNCRRLRRQPHRPRYHPFTLPRRSHPHFTLHDQTISHTVELQGK